MLVFHSIRKLSKKKHYILEKQLLLSWYFQERKYFRITVIPTIFGLQICCDEKNDVKIFSQEIEIN